MSAGCGNDRKPILSLRRQVCLRIGHTARESKEYIFIKRDRKSNRLWRCDNSNAKEGDGRGGGHNGCRESACTRITPTMSTREYDLYS